MLCFQFVHHGGGGVPQPGPGQDGGTLARSRWGDTPVRSRQGGTTLARSRCGVPWPGMGYPPSGPAMGSLPTGPGMEYPPVWTWTWDGVPPQLGQQKEYSLRGGRYASCVHAGRLCVLQVCLSLDFTSYIFI